MRIKLLLAAVLMLSANMAAAKNFVALPALDAGGSDLKIRFVRYTGGTNGEMVVDIKNGTRKAQSFNAEGLFFVPDGDPEKAPQRLGAAGPFRAQAGKAWKESEKIQVAAGQTRRVHLQVFCIDSHRSSPSASHTFSIAKKRLPKKLRQKIVTGTKGLIKNHKGDTKKAKSAIQNHVWKSRDADWIELQGERAVEKK
jgi:hypothetical protein